MTNLNKNSEQTQATIINGTVVTQECLDELKQLQENDNSMLQSYRESVSDTICFLAKNIEQLEHDPEIQKLMVALGYLRDALNNLRKP